MKNKYLTKYLCITLVSAMVLSGPMAVFGFEDGAESGQEEIIPPEEPEQPAVPTEAPAEPSPEPPAEPVPGETEQPTPTPGETEPSVTPVPGEAEDPTPTPGVPSDPAETPVPEEPTITPEPTDSPDPSVTPTPTPVVAEDLEDVQEIIDRLNALAQIQLTLDQAEEVAAIRGMYEALTEEKKLLVTNYDLLEEFESVIKELETEKEFSDGEDGDAIDIFNVRTGTPVYYTNMVSNLHAGKDFYLDSLKQNYQITFSDDFAEVMDEIESEYKEKQKLSDADSLSDTGVTTSKDLLLARNWQDILAIYIFEKKKSDPKAEEFKLDASSKEDLARIFEEMNPIVRDKNNIQNVTYGNRHLNYYIKKNHIGRRGRRQLKKYVETDCKLLCATVTAAKGFVRQSVGDDVSEERVNVISAAYSLVGKVGYFWGGKSTVLGEDPTWGAAERVSAAGSPSTGTMRAFGLDCSGFVTWAVINGYQDQAMQASIGDGTSNQWVNANVVSEEDAQPGDLVFQRGPEAGSDNHVGIICGKTDAGDWIAVHCSSSKNGVTVGEAYGASFRYIRQPDFYPEQAEIDQITQERDEILAAADTDLTDGNASPEKDPISAGSVPGQTADTGAGVSGNGPAASAGDITAGGGSASEDEIEIFVADDAFSSYGPPAPEGYFSGAGESDVMVVEADSTVSEYGPPAPQGNIWTADYIGDTVFQAG